MDFRNSFLRIFSAVLLHEFFRFSSLAKLGKIDNRRVFDEKMLENAGFSAKKTEGRHPAAGIQNATFSDKMIVFFVRRLKIRRIFCMFF